MKIFLSPNTLKKQTKTLIKNWPVKASKPFLKVSEARDILCHLYGYKNPHHYKKDILKGEKSTSIRSKVLLNQHIEYFIQRMDFLTNLGQNQSFALLKMLWPDYLNSKRVLMHQCRFSFFGDLTVFLPKGQQNEIIEYGFNDSPSIKDAIEAIGVPHPEVELILVNQGYVDLSYQIQGGDDILVYPTGNDLNADNADRLNLLPNQKPTFVLDVHLGTLARYLRMAGFDTSYQATDLGDEKLAIISEKENRIILTRDVNLLKRSNITYGRFVRTKDKRRQFEEIVNHYDLGRYFKPFQHCTECNGKIEPVLKSEIENKVPALIFRDRDEFKQCSGCHKIYWKGSHYDRMLEFLEPFKASLKETPS